MLLERECGELFEEELSALQPTAGIPKWRWIGQLGPKSNGLGVESSSRKSSPPPQKEFLAEQLEYLAAPFSEKNRKTFMAYPWNPLVALGMGEAD